MLDDSADPKALAKIVRSLRKTLGWSQSKLAETLGIDQTTVSQYELGRAAPSTEVLIKLSALAPNKELREAFGRLVGVRFSGFWEATFFALSEKDKKAFINAFMQPPRRRFVFDLAEVLSRPEAPSFLQEIMSLYLRFRNRSDAPQIFEEASTWLRVQFQMRDYLDQKAAHQSDSDAALPFDQIEADLRESASEPLARTGGHADVAGFADILRDVELIASLKKRIAELEVAEGAAPRPAKTAVDITKAGRSRRSKSKTG